MGMKGDRASATGAAVVAAIVPTLESVGKVSTKRMFGGHGIFESGKMFALVTSSAELYFKVDDSNRAQFVKSKSP